MNKYSYNWRDSMRLRMGLTWRNSYPLPSDYPSMGKCVVLMLIVGFLWACVMTMDYADQVEHQAAVAEKRANALGDCVQGKLRLFEHDEAGKPVAATVCRKAEEIKL